ncbi:hypothetical protein niasHT_005266 [Heterodera trifolii]|uniref:Uncharacterized protein n=1 Tax=Heterodera trifolii TaxID=157864 RepID=A0ABD2LS13_9BILA
MDLSDLAVEFEDSLNLRHEGAVSEEDWLFGPEDGTDTSAAVKTTEEKQNLDKWLRGAVEKVDFRTRSALSRRLEKKKRKADKEKRLKCGNNAENSLSMIEEVSNESGPMSDREQRTRPREKENMAARKAISEASVCSEDEEDEEEYFDAPSTPKKTQQLTNSVVRNNCKQQSPGRIMPKMGNNRQTLLGTNGGTPKGIGHKGPKRNARTIPSTKRQLPMQQEEEDGSGQDEVLVEWRDLSDIERRAKEQERELQLELMRSRCQRLGNACREVHVGTPATRPRPDSDSSSTSSVLSGGNGSGAAAYIQPHSHLATSKSVDFRSSSGHVADHSSVASSRSNEGSLADLSCCSDSLNQPPNSRLPLPRRPTIPGKTGIPLPTPKKTPKMSVVQMGKRSPHLGFEQLDDEECF